MAEIVIFAGPDGEPIEVEIPDGLTDAEAREFFAQSQAEPERRQIPRDPARVLGERILAGEQTAVGFGESLTQIGVGAAASRIPGLRGRGGLFLESGVQGLISAAFETSRQLASGDVSGQDIAEQGALGFIAPPALRGAARVGSATARTATAIRQGAPITFPRENLGRLPQSAAQAAQGGGGNAGALRHNARLVNQDAARAAGVPEDMIPQVRNAGFDEETLRAARGTINRLYDDAGPTELVAVGRLKVLLEEMIEKHSLPDAEIQQILNRIGDRTTIDPGAWQGIQRSLRDISVRIGRNPTFAGQRGLVDDAIDLLDDQAVASGANRELLGEANQRFKILATIEEINSVPESGQLPANQLIRKMMRDNFRGFGRRTIAEGADERLIPDVRRLIDTAKGASQLNRAIAGGSPTAARIGTFGGPLAGATAMATGVLSPGGSVLLGLGGFGLMRGAAFAALGAEPGPAARAILGAGAQVLPSVFNQPEERER